LRKDYAGKPCVAEPENGVVGPDQETVLAKGRKVEGSFITVGLAF
jgi:hypothetical protein